MSIHYHFLCCEGLTNASGIAQINVQVPGVFGADLTGASTGANPLNGYEPPHSQGRYLEYAEIWAPDGVEGDIIQALEVRDDDGLIPELTRVAFPDYPVIMSFCDSEAQASSGARQGLFLRVGETLKVQTPSKQPTFVAAGLYIRGEYLHGASGTDKRVKCNFYWGKMV